MKTMLLDNSKKSIEYAVNSLKSGNVGIFPTDTVYGIGCDALNIDALKKLYKTKKRPLNKPINILVSDINMVSDFVKNINQIEQKLIETFWPGALTIIFDKSEIVPDILTSNLDTIGIRMPNNNVCLDIIRKFSKPIATSSANISEKDPYTCINNDVLKDFEDTTDFILDDGKILNGTPSTIVKVLSHNELQILRKGSISRLDIENCLGGKINVR